jgi:predicted permease
LSEAGSFNGLRRSASAFGRDLGIAGRRLRATPLFTAFAVLSLGLGVGATTAAYSAMYTLGARPRGVQDEDRLVLLTRLNAISRTTPTRVSWADYQDLRAQQRSFSDVVAWTDVYGVLVGRASSERVGAEAVTGRYFSALGVRPAIGRLVGPGDDRPDAPAVLVLSDQMWRRQFGADPAVIGTTIRFAQQPFEIVGVAPASFRGVTAAFVGQFVVWVPLAHAPRTAARPSLTFDPSRRDALWLLVAGRLQPSATVERAAMDVGAIGRGLDATAPLPMALALPAVRTWGATPLDEISTIFDAEAIRIAVALPFLVLLVAGTNLANLVLSRGSSRRHEIAVRGALGASRWRLLQEQLMETAVIAAAGGLVGVLVTHGLLTWAVSVLRQPLEAIQPGFHLAWRLEPVVFAAAAAGALLLILVAGLVPAVQMTRVDTGRTLTVGDSSAALPRWRWRSNLIALQVGVSTSLFLITVICVRFLVVDVPARYRDQAGLAAVAVASVSFDPRTYTAARVGETAARIVDQARRLPDVAAVSASTALPVEAMRMSPRESVEVTAPGRPFPLQRTPESLAYVVAAMPMLETAMGLDLVGGRFVNEADAGRAQPVAVIDADVAHGVFGSTTVIGRNLLIRRGGAGPGAPRIETTLAVVGVVSPAPRPVDREERRLGMIYIPFADRTSSTITFVARAASGDATALVTGLRAAVRHINPDLAVGTAGRVDLLAAGPFVLARFFATAFGSLAILSLALAMAGLYGVLSHVVSKRAREMGLRLALGASTGRIAALVLKQGMRPVVEGLLIGLAVAIVVRQLLQANLTGTLSTVNVATFALAAVPLVVAGVIAAYLPARRASRVDPNVALRDL